MSTEHTAPVITDTSPVNADTASVDTQKDTTGENDNSSEQH